MLDLLLATAALTGVLLVLALLGLGLTVVPFVLACDLAERRGASVAGTGALQLLLTGAGLLGALLVQRSDLPGALLVLPLLLALAVPAVLALVPGPARAVLGRQARHE